MDASTMFARVLDVPPDAPRTGRPLTADELATIREHVHRAMQQIALAYARDDPALARDHLCDALCAIRDLFIVQHGVAVWESERAGVLNWMLSGVGVMHDVH
jgi:hypothetical protein